MLLNCGVGEVISVCLPFDASHNTYRLTWVSLTLDVGYLFKARVGEAWLGANVWVVAEEEDAGAGLGGSVRTPDPRLPPGPAMGTTIHAVFSVAAALLPLPDADCFEK